MGLKGYKLWDMGQLDYNLQRPTAGSNTGYLSLWFHFGASLFSIEGRRVQ
jgi:hypothetical protein